LALQDGNAAPRVSAQERLIVQLDCGLSSRTSNASARLSRAKLFLLAASVAVLIAPSTAFADATLSPGLRDQAAAHPQAVFKVIVQGEPGHKSKAIGSDVVAVTAARPGKGVGLKRGFLSIDGVSADLTGAQILRLAGNHGIEAITEDTPVYVTSSLSNDQLWPYSSEVAQLWPTFSNSSVKVPTIALVDSGIQSRRKDFGNRVLADVSLSSLPNNSAGDGRGHGTFVASIAAGSADGYAGSSPNAKLVSLDVIDDSGMGLTSDVIAAADWILQNKARFNIRVANFSLTGSTPSSFRFDPLDKAVERLWFSGVVVVAAAGNYGDQMTGVLSAPGNDPFVITVGADDVAGTVPVGDDFPAPWSAYGSTLDGFLKPEVSAPGRMLIGAVPADSVLAHERPDRIVAPGYMAMSGTSFSTALVSGIAADILAMNPRWTPDQVKGALMRTARPLSLGQPFAAGIGEISGYAAARATDPPNPNAALNEFLIPDPTGGTIPVFDEATWTTAALANPAWDAATWTTATWTTAAWSAATWTTATWTTATWTTATWTTATWTTATWTTATWTTATWTTSLVAD
jgi:serine protease AprX